jgi:putative transposase
MKNKDEYKILPAKVSSAIIISVQQNFKSFFKALSDFNKNPSKYKAKPKLPNYLHKEDGRFITSYTNQAISKKVFNKANKILLSKTNIEFRTRIIDFNVINCVRIVPRNGYYMIEVVYTIKENEKLNDNNRYYSIDLGINNLATVTSNVNEIKPIAINGKPLKSINQYYNKKKANIQSLLEVRNGKKISKNINKLNIKRKNKIDNYLFKSCKIIINNCKENEINSIVIGYNEGWKQDINIGKRNNQNFVNIPYSRFISIIKYKCEIEGINIITNEESYTSKCSFLDNEPINKHESYQGKRIKRGLFKSFNGRLINADVNGSYNIMKKAIPNAFANGIEGIGVCPEIIKISK